MFRGLVRTKRRQSRTLEEPVMNQPSTYVGLDVHKKDIVVALLLPLESEPTFWTIRNEPRAVRRLGKRLRREAQGEILCVYEAGPCG